MGTHFIITNHNYYQWNMQYCNNTNVAKNSNFFFWSCNYLRNFSLIYPTFSSFCFFRHKITVLIFFFFGMHFQRLKSSPFFWKHIFALKEYCILLDISINFLAKNLRRIYNTNHLVPTTNFYKLLPWFLPANDNFCQTSSPTLFDYS